MIASASRSTPSATDDAVARHPLHRAGDQLDVVAEQGRVPVAGERARACSRSRSRGSPWRAAPGRGRASRRRSHVRRASANRREHARMAGEPVREQLEEGELADPAAATRSGEALEQAPLPARVAAVRLRQDPGRRALVDRRRARRSRRSRGRTGSRSRRCRSRRRGARRDRRRGPTRPSGRPARRSPRCPRSRGIAGRVSCPQAVTRTSNCALAAVGACAASSARSPASNSARRPRSPNRRWGSIPKLRETSSR